jgi:hypothetical protein
MAWEHLNKGRLLPKDIDRKIISLNDSLNVGSSEVVNRVQELENILGLSVKEISVSSGITSTDTYLRKFLNIPEYILLTRLNQNSVDIKKDEATLIHLINNNLIPTGGHFIA